MSARPRILITLGDVAGIGPEILVKAWPQLVGHCQPVVIGDPDWLHKTIGERRTIVQSITDLSTATPDQGTIPCLPVPPANLANVALGKIPAEAGRAAHDWLAAAIDLTMSKQADAIVTLPLHKEGLHQAGFDYPGHTEILAERTGVKNFAM